MARICDYCECRLPKGVGYQVEIKAVPIGWNNKSELRSLELCEECKIKLIKEVEV